MGATDPAKADAGTLRKEFGASIENNATHGSDAPETAAFELGTSSRAWSWPDRDQLGKLLVVVGLVIAAIGVLMIVGVPFGRLPGDVVYPPRQRDVLFSARDVDCAQRALAVRCCSALMSSVETETRRRD